MTKRTKTSIGEGWTVVPDRLQWDDVGGRLLANIARGIYNHEAVLREYVQNACDAYSMLDSEDESQTITIRAEGGNVSIQDSGIGMDESHIKSVKKVAVSNKDDFEDLAGFRGIGVWAGLQACRDLVITTTKKGTNKRYRLTINFSKIVERFDDNINIKELIDPNYTIASSPAARDEHYTRTTLTGILPGYEKLLDCDELKRITSSILPCRVDPTFEKASRVEDILNGISAYKDYSIKVGEEEVFRRKPAQQVNDPIEQVLKASNGTELARVWYCSTRETSLDPAGFQLRVKNIAVGAPNIYGIEKAESYNVSGDIQLSALPRLDWFFGEIHVTNTELRPNTPRNDIELDEVSKELISAIRRFYADRISEAAGRSDFNGIVKVLRRTEQLDDDTRLESGSGDERDAREWLERLEKAGNKLKGRATTEKDRVFRQLLKQALISKRRKAATSKLKKLLPAASAKKRRVKVKLKNGDRASQTFDKKREKLISSIIRLLERRIGIDHEEFQTLSVEISELVTNWSGANAAE